MISMDQARTLQGKTLMGAGGDKLGKIDTLYADREDGEPTFATVQTGLFGSKTHFVPLANASLSGDTVTVPYDKDLVSSAPNIDEDAELSPEEEERLYAHYGLGSGYSGTTGTTDYQSTTTTTTGTTGVTGGRTDRDGDGVYDDVQGRTVGRDTSGATTDDAMTRSEERLKVGTQQTEAGRARLRKYIVSEQQNVTVPVTSERAVVTSEPITEANADRAYDGPALSEEEHEVTLRSERPVVEKETVPVERVRLDTERVTENVQVSEEVRKEQIEVEGDVEGGTRGGGTRR